MTGDQIVTIKDAFLREFSRDSLAQMLRLRLNKELSFLVSDGSFNSVIFDLVLLAERQGWLVNLVSAACQTKPDSPALKALRAAYPQLFATSDPTREPADAPDSPESGMP